MLCFLYTECFEDFSSGLYWEVAFDGDTVSKPCRDVDERFRYQIVHTSSLVINLQSISVTYCFIPEVIVVEISIEDSVIPTCPSCVGYIPNSLRQAWLCQH